MDYKGPGEVILEPPISIPGQANPISLNLYNAGTDRVVIAAGDPCVTFAVVPEDRVLEAHAQFKENVDAFSYTAVQEDKEELSASGVSCLRVGSFRTYSQNEASLLSLSEACAAGDVAVLSCPSNEFDSYFYAAGLHKSSSKTPPYPE